MKPYIVPDYERQWRSLERATERLRVPCLDLDRLINDPMASGHGPNDFEAGPMTAPHQTPDETVYLARQKRRRELRNDVVLIVVFVAALVAITWAITGIRW